MNDSLAATAAQAEPSTIVAEAVAFDLDGTLLDTLHDLVAAANAWLREDGLPPLSKDTIRPLVGKGIANLVRRALAIARAVPPQSLSDVEVEAALASFESQYAALLGRDTVLFPGVREGLDRMTAMGLPLAVVTNKAARFVGPHLEHAGIAQYFAIVLGGDALPTKKPHPGPLLHIAASLDVPVAQLLMVGDSANDVQAARAAGCPILVLPYGYSEGIPVEQLGADGVVDSLVVVADRLHRARAMPTPRAAGQTLRRG